MASAPLMPLDAMLASIPGLPRPVLARLVARMIDRLDDMEPDVDLEEGGDAEPDDFAEDNEPLKWGSEAVVRVKNLAGCDVGHVLHGEPYRWKKHCTK